jgi:microcystin-dependent protein
MTCDGSAIGRIEYNNLFSIISTNYGAGNGSTTFNIPDLRGRFAVGKNTIATYNITRVPIPLALGSIGGKFEHTLNSFEMASHRHEFDTDKFSGGGRNVWSQGAGTDDALSSAGGSLAHSTIPPYQVLNFIIKT